ncbi:hypothetical protein IAG44_25135 [Streptomyces roseirectus]|uniref:Integral membrane protein n=1 Tax=Streptomyces roseirectus TaxID=2768066 RepID=A0A7H0IHW4_9ACTN|nr:hypothetical protein [Streptomyces roseirectus]QNP72380.1 hypothetical protein IAG44_25135 [Streptomyces roseirectus]
MTTRAWVLVLAALFAVCQLAHVDGRDTPDSKNYLSYALSLSGYGKREAAAATIGYVCAGRGATAARRQGVDVTRFREPSPGARVAAACRAKEWRAVEARLRAGQVGGHTVPFASERFMRIFEARPGYPAYLVPFTGLLGVRWGVWAASVTVAVLGGLLVFLVLRTLRAPPYACLTGQALYYLLPVGTTAMRPMTEGLMLALTLTALWGCALALDGRVRAGACLIAAALAALFTVKHSQALFLGLCLGGAAAVSWCLRRGRGLAAIAAVGLCGVVGTLLLARLLRFPSASESVQDLLTGHFAQPDRERPWSELVRLEARFWVEWGRRQLWEPLLLVSVVAGVVGVLRRRAFGVCAVATGCTGVLTQAGHPDIGIWGGRLIVLVWVVPVVGVPLLLERCDVRGAGEADGVRVIARQGDRRLKPLAPPGK